MKVGIAVTVVLSSAVTTIALMSAFFLGVSFGQGIPASHPPKQGEARMAITINTRDGKEAEMVVYENLAGNNLRIVVSS